MRTCPENEKSCDLHSTLLKIKKTKGKVDLHLSNTVSRVQILLSVLIRDVKLFYSKKMTNIVIGNIGDQLAEDKLDGSQAFKFM